MKSKLRCESVNLEKISNGDTKFNSDCTSESANLELKLKMPSESESLDAVCGDVYKREFFFLNVRLGIQGRRPT